MKKNSKSNPSLALTTQTVRALQDNQLTIAAGGRWSAYPCTRIDVSQNCPG
ncbi:MAG: class I lanthipeptide [Deltaproteobacteria bacterium]|nr:class I lanthipeptide [Deltaproteobacteria bacterium]